MPSLTSLDPCRIQTQFIQVTVHQQQATRLLKQENPNNSRITLYLEVFQLLIGLLCSWWNVVVRFYKGIVPLWGRQIPYTMMKFACFERTVEALYKYVVPKPRSQCSKPEQLVVTFIAGYIGMCLA